MWTDRTESDVTCDGPLGWVEDNESVARLLVEMIPPSGWRPFTKAHFTAPEDGNYSNVCGASHGCSVDRADALTTEDLLARSEAFASAAQAAAEARKPQKIVRTGGGAMTANVGSLRGVRVASAAGQKTLFIYADPIAINNTEHAVIRVRNGVAEEDWPLLLDDIAACFA